MTDEVEVPQGPLEMSIPKARNMVRALLTIQKIAEASQDYIDQDASMSTLVIYCTNIRVAAFNAACDVVLAAYRYDGSKIDYPAIESWDQPISLATWDFAMKLATQVRKDAERVHDPSLDEHSDILQKVDAVVSMVDAIQGGFILDSVGFDYARERSKFEDQAPASVENALVKNAEGVSEGSYL